MGSVTNRDYGLDTMPSGAGDGTGGATTGERRLATPSEVASDIQVPVKTLYTWRYKRVGPRAHRVGRHLRYRKVRSRIESTRGLFLSVAGFRSEVLAEAAALLNLVLMDGQDLTLVLEGRISLREALRLKLDRAAQQESSSIRSVNMSSAASSGRPVHATRVSRVPYEHL
jgi:hypothetical protein